MHHVSRIEDAAARTPKLYEQHSNGFRRATYVDRAMGSVHMGVGICYLDPGGVIHPHLHSFEESFYVLEGPVTVQIGSKELIVTSHKLCPMIRVNGDGAKTFVSIDRSAISVIVTH